jgi:hypothetical protein
MFDLAGIECLPVNVYRMGVRPGDLAANPSPLAGNRRRSGPRLVKVELPTKRLARDLLQNRGKFSDMPSLKDVHVRPSLSPDQLTHRNALYKRRTELNGLEENGGDPYVVWGPPGREELMKKSEVPKRR